MNYQAIIDNLKVDSVIALMKKLGADKYEDKGTHLIFPTICHNEDIEHASMKLYFYLDKKIFVCYTEDGTMSIFKFLKTYYETRGIEYDWYQDIYNVILDCANFHPQEGFQRPVYHSLKDKYGVQRKEVKLPTYNEGVLDCFVVNYTKEWLNDGISRAAMDKFGIKFSISQNKIVIPHRNINGELIGIRGRALNEWEVENVGKYMPIQVEQTWYTHPLSMNLYGLYENLQNIKHTGICYVFESEKSVLQFEAFNMPHCAVAVCGSQFNKYQLNLLLKYCQPREIVICFDNEEIEGSDKYFNKLWAIGNKYKQYCDFSFIYDRKGLTKLKDSPSDHGEEIFKQLLERRVKVR